MDPVYSKSCDIFAVPLLFPYNTFRINIRILLYYYYRDYMNIEHLSLSELKQLLSKIENELSIIDNEHHICNDIAKTFTGQSLYAKSEYNKKLRADIQIQLDILEFMNNGGHIQYNNHSGKLNSKSVKGAKSGIRLYRKFSV